MVEKWMTYLKNWKMDNAISSKTTEVRHRLNVMIETACLTFSLVSSSLRSSFCMRASKDIYQNMLNILQSQYDLPKIWYIRRSWFCSPTNHLAGNIGKLILSPPKRRRILYYYRDCIFNICINHRALASRFGWVYGAALRVALRVALRQKCLQIWSQNLIKTLIKSFWVN